VTELAARLQEALGAGYRLDRELGGGGMSRVFVAQDVALGRFVVVKVLPPELAAGVSLDRFQREIRVAAALQHPHIVPLLAAGGAGDLFWYSMPLVEGESLRVRLAREHALPVPFVLRTLREVADALSHAHAHGVVHRDIKPDNILLAGRHALVTDFGVARALNASLGTGMTSTGLAVGTPAYMAPEQAAAEPHVDGRADIYALGVMGWEMLAGRALFVGSAPQVLAAHVSLSPDPLARHRPQVPAALEAAIMRCLEKQPADRWQSADELLAALDEVSVEHTQGGAANSPALGTVPAVVPSVANGARVAVEGAGGSTVPPPAARRTNLRRAGALALVVLLAAIAFGLFQQRGASAADVSQRRMFVAEFENNAGDSTLARAATEAIRVALSQSDMVTDIPSGVIRAALARMQRPPGQRLDAATARELAEREGIPVFVTGEVSRVGSGFHLVARLESPDSGGRVVAVARSEARDESALLDAMDRLGRQLRREIGESERLVRASRPLPDVSTASLEALRAFADGIHASQFRDDDATASRLFERAIAEDSMFASAHRALGVLLINRQLDRARARAAMSRAFALRERLPERERLRTEASYYQLAAGDVESAVLAHRAILARWPDDVVALNNLALIHLAAYELDSALALFTRQVAVDSMNLLSVRNLAFAWSVAGQLDSADFHLRRLEARGRNPTALVFRAGWFAEQLDFVRADSVFRVLDSTQRTNAQLRATAAAGHAAVAAMQGRMREAGRWSEAASEILAQAGLARPALTEQLSMAYIEAVAAGDSARASERIERALARWPLATFGPRERPYHAVALAHLLIGERARARAVLERYAREIPDSTRASEAPPPRQVALAVLALIEGDARRAVAEAGRTDEGRCPPPVCAGYVRGLAWQGAGEPDSAIAAWEMSLRGRAMARLLDEASGRIRLSDPVWRIQMERRLAALLEQRGDSARAAELCEAVATRWRNADAELRDVVQECEQRAARMRGRGPG
jgi:tetratricopeptide (TPR) repeat protein